MKVYVVCEIWGWGEIELDRVFSTREKAVDYIANKMMEYKNDDDEEVMENNLEEIKAKLQTDLCAYSSYYRGYAKKLE